MRHVRYDKVEPKEPLLVMLLKYFIMGSALCVLGVVAWTATSNFHNFGVFGAIVAAVTLTGFVMMVS